jgi:acyl-coenzyme A synthetase/AMP-(fatty) acid ligase
MDGDEIVSPGEVGECVLYGSQLCPGYWDNEPETSTRFVRFPLDPRLPQVWYRTGDLLRLNEDGLFIYVGRVDNQVKIRGHRVEIEEVEQAFASHTSVAEIAVVALKIENAPHEARLVAFVGCRDEVDEDELRAHVATALPRHMVPTRIFTSRLMLPRNNNGKIDRQALRNRAADN